MSGLIHPVLTPGEITATYSALPDGHTLGEVRFGADGNLYKLCKTKTAIPAAGYVMVQQIAAIAAITNITAYSAGNDFADPSLTDNTAITVSAGELAGAHLFVHGGTGEGQLLRVKKHAAFAAAAPTLYLAEAAATALDTTSDVSVLLHGQVDLCTAGTITETVVGVSIGAVTDEYYFWALKQGVGLVWVKGSACAATSLLTPGGATDAGKAAIQDGSFAAVESIFAKVLVAPTSSDMPHLCAINCHG